MKHCLTIAGSDPSGGAGIQADLKSFSANGTFGMSVITSVVAENTREVISIRDLDAGIIRDQIDAVFSDIRVDAVKVGMLSVPEIIETVVDKLAEYRPAFVVIDPVMVAKGGCALMQPEALSALKEKMIPLASLLTPNIPEAETITGKTIRTLEEMKTAAREICAMGAKAVLVKGGHREGDATDLLFDGEKDFLFQSERIQTKNTHGTGCTLSSAIAANLANGLVLPEAVKKAKDYVTGAIAHAFDLGHGHGPTNHFYEFYQWKGIE